MIRQRRTGTDSRHRVALEYNHERPNIAIGECPRTLSMAAQMLLIYSE